MLTAIIMASGYGARAGGDKLLLDLDGLPLIEHTIDKLHTFGFEEIVLVTRQGKVADIGYENELSVVINEKAAVGKSSSIVLGVESSKNRSDYMFFVGDQPLLSTRVICKLIQTYHDNRDKIITPKVGDRYANPSIFPNLFRNDLLQLKDDEGGKEVMLKYKDKVVAIDVNDPNSFLDLDTMEDYEKIKRLYTRC